MKFTPLLRPPTMPDLQDNEFAVTFSQPKLGIKLYDGAGVYPVISSVSPDGQAAANDPRIVVGALLTGIGSCPVDRSNPSTLTGRIATLSYPATLVFCTAHEMYAVQDESLEFSVEDVKAAGGTMSIDLISLGSDELPAKQFDELHNPEDKEMLAPLLSMLGTYVQSSSVDGDDTVVGSGSFNIVDERVVVPIKSGDAEIECSFDCAWNLSKRVNTIDTRITFQAPRLGLSIIDTNVRREILYTSISGLRAEIIRCSDSIFVNASAGNFQVDNMLDNPMYKVVFSTATELLSVSAHVSASAGMLDVHYLYINCKDMSMHIEESMLAAVVAFASNIALPHVEISRDVADTLQLTSSEYGDYDDASSFKLLIRSCFVGPIKIALEISLASSGDGEGDLVEALNVLDALPGLKSVIGGIIHSVGSISDAALQLTSFVVVNREFDSLGACSREIANQYMRQISSNILRIMGSLDTLGNPLGIVNSVGDAAKVLIFDTAAKFNSDGVAGAAASVKESAGLATSALIMIGNGVFGVSDTISRVAARFTLDPDFVAAQDRERGTGCAIALWQYPSSSYTEVRGMQS